MSWGYETRAAAVRIPGGSNAARRIEHRVAGADANPYLVLAAMLGAALEGIENGIEPPEPMAAAREAALPIDWKQAIEAFERERGVARIFAPILRETFLGMKKQELQVFSSRSARSSTRPIWRRCDCAAAYQRPACDPAAFLAARVQLPDLAVAKSGRGRPCGGRPRYRGHPGRPRPDYPRPAGPTPLALRARALRPTARARQCLACRPGSRAKPHWS